MAHIKCSDGTYYRTLLANAYSSTYVSSNVIWLSPKWFHSTLYRAKSKNLCADDRYAAVFSCYYGCCLALPASADKQKPVFLLLSCSIAQAAQLFSLSRYTITMYVLIYVHVGILCIYVAYCIGTRNDLVLLALFMGPSPPCI